MLQNAQPTSGSDELRRAFAEFIEKYKALEAQKERLMLEFLKKTDEMVAKELVSGLKEKE